MTRVESWERKVEVPLLLLAAAFLVAYAWPILDPRISRPARADLGVVSWTVWAAFAIDFGIRIALADGRLTYLRRHWYDVALIVLPMLRPLRLLRLLALARILNRAATRTLAERLTVYVVGTAIAAVGLGALAVLDAEQHAPNPNIKSIGDALWWATTTVTTVGYGDRYPVTVAGRLVAVVLMIVGIGLIGSITAATAAWFVSSLNTTNGENDDTSGQA